MFGKGDVVNVGVDVGTETGVVTGVIVGAFNTADVVEITGGTCDGAGVGEPTQAPSKTTTTRRIVNSVLVFIDEIS